MKSMAVTMPVMPPFAPVRRAASLLLLAKTLHTSVTVVPSGTVTGGCDRSTPQKKRKRVPADSGRNEAGSERRLVMRHPKGDRKV